MSKLRLRAAGAAMAAAALVMTVSPAHAEVPAGVADVPSYQPVSPWHVQNMVDDMKLHNDGTNNGQNPYYGSSAGWAAGPGRVVMGAIPKGSNGPDYWRDIVTSSKYTGDAYWNAMNPWMVVFTLPDNKATNTRVELSSIRAYVLSKKTNTWELVQDHKITGGIYDKTYKPLKDVKPDERHDGDYALIKPPAASAEHIYHGWGEPMTLKDPADIKAVHIRVFARLVKDNPNGPDDRHLARYTLQVGGDYYPYQGSTIGDKDLQMQGGGQWFPGIGMSRAVLVTSEQRLTSFSTITSGVQEPGNTKDPSGSLSEQEFRQNPPPF